ncbi:MAG: cobyrinate a,c-diamide synthase [Lachnospiraceae bacterium]|nr:cobyrinate a,c-diamide synthase [Lachnospiraceae bacterium]
MTEKKKCPRILFAGTHSGVGKTTITCALLRALQKRGKKPAAYKCGPDYIDPMFHREVLGVDSGNLDSFFQDEKQLKRSLLQHTQDIAVIEGAMGYYDGIGFASSASTAEVAALTQTPVVLVVDCRGRALSALAEIYGFVHFRPEGAQIKGVLLNRLPERLYAAAAEQIRAMGLIPVGFLPEQKEFQLKSRHLGLVTPQEIEGFQEQMDDLAKRLAQTVDLAGIEDLAEEAPMIEETDGLQTEEVFSVKEDKRVPVRIAVARDSAFCFYYRENLEILEAYGCEILDFSPCQDTSLPDCDGLILPGGYPELYAEALQKNERMRCQICDKIQNGLPTIAECGGFLYLHQRLTDAEGRIFQGTGALKADCSYKGFQRQFGYIELTAQKEQLLAEAGDTLKAHEFHYFVSEQTCDAFRAEKTDHSRSWMAGVATDTLYAGFPHIAFSGSPKAAKRFAEAAKRYHKKHQLRNDQPNE